MTTRKVVPVVDQNSAIGAWHLISDTCPMHVHQDAIGAKHEHCMAGISTNMQGDIPLGKCKHAGKFNHEAGEVDCQFVASTSAALMPDAKEGR